MLDLKKKWHYSCYIVILIFKECKQEMRVDFNFVENTTKYLESG